MRRFFEIIAFSIAAFIGLAMIVRMIGPAPKLPDRPPPTPVAVGEPISPWPFKPDRLSLSCQMQVVGDLHVRRVYVVTDDDKTYAVNGSARAFAPLTTPIETNPDTSAVIQRGLALCRDRAGPIFIRRP